MSKKGPSRKVNKHALGFKERSKQKGHEQTRVRGTILQTIYILNYNFIYILKTTYICYGNNFTQVQIGLL